MKKEIEKIVADAIKKLKKSQNLADFEIPKIAVEYAKNEKYGDYATNVAMVLGKMAKKNPLEVAKDLTQQLTTDNLQQFKKIEFAAPGYVNFYLSNKYFQSRITEINKQQEKFGNSEIGKGKKINNEFISANPTAPLHLGNGRGGFYGDSIGQVCRKTGFEVVNEYYVNDFGEQVIKLGHSVLGDDEAVYAGDYIEYLRDKLKEGKYTTAGTAGLPASAIIMSDFIKPTVLEKMKINFDSWISEKSLYEDGYVNRAIEILKKKKLTYEQNGALWLETTGYGDDKDRVLIKKDGQKTYIASDCGYILNKIERKFDKIVEIWGADHHGYVNRFEAVAEALGFSGELKFIIVQLVRLVKNGREVRMSKRAGNVIYVDKLIEKIGHDAARFFFLMYSPDAHMNFDLGLAEKKSQKNPVYYVQYAHARICSILNKVKNSKLKACLPVGKVKSNPNLSLLSSEKELSLMKELSKFPEIIEEIAENYEVHKLPYYAIKLSDKFHSFYDACRVIDEKNPKLTQARLNLVSAVKIVLAETLRLIGVGAPEKM